MSQNKAVFPITIAVDFDGTCVTHEYPKVGREIGAISILKKLIEKGHKLILFTMRSNRELQDAINWFVNNEIPLYGINKNPTQENWTNSPKAYAQLYIDDAALGAPLLMDIGEFDTDISKIRPYMDWNKVEAILINKGIL